MKFKTFIALAIFLSPLSAISGPCADEFSSFSKYLQDKFAQFKADPQLGYVRYGSPAIAARYAGRSSRMNYNLNQFPEGDSRNYVKGQIIQQMGTLAQALAQTAGTALAFDNANQLRQQATQLNASGDPQLQQIGSEMNQEATAVEQGDRSQAGQIANQISSTPMPYVSPSYTPGQQESVFAQALNTAVSGMAVAALGALSNVAAAKLLTSLGLGSLGMGGVLSTGAMGLANGQSGGSVANNTGAAAAYNASGQATNYTNTKINTLTAPSGQPAGNSGSLPSAGQ